LWQEYGQTPERFVDRLDTASQKTFSRTLNVKVKEFFGLEDDAPTLRATLGANLSLGRLRFVALMDQLDDRLRNLIAFVNSNSKFTVYGAELEFYSLDDYTIVIPRLFGADALKSDPGSGTGRRSWDEQSFFDDAKERVSAAVLTTMRDLYDFSKDRASTVS